MILMMHVLPVNHPVRIIVLQPVQTLVPHHQEQAVQTVVEDAETVVAEDVKVLVKDVVVDVATLVKPLA